MAALVVLVSTVISYGEVALARGARDLQGVVSSLNQLQTITFQIDALRRQAGSDPTSQRRYREQILLLADARTRVRAQLEATGASSTLVEQLARAIDRDEADWSAIALGQGGAANDESASNPGADLQRLLAQSIAAASEAADRAAFLAAAVSSGTVATSVGFAGLLFWRYRRSRALAQTLQRTERSLRESERRLSSLVRNATDVVFILSPDGTIKYKSPAAALMWGYRPETLIGWHYLRIIHPDDQAKAEDLLNQTAQRPQVNVGAELRFQAAAGTWRDAEVIAINLLDDSAVSGTVLTCRDITYRKRADDKIRALNVELEQRVVDRTAQLQAAIGNLREEVRERQRVEEERGQLLQQIERERSTLLGVTASMTDGLIVLSSSGEVRFCNLQAGRLLGLPPNEMVSQHIEHVWWRKRHEFADPERAWTGLEAALGGGQAGQRFDVTLAGPSLRDMVVECFPLDRATGDEAQTGVILRDVTAERNLDRTKDELVSVVSHELRTPLTSVVGFAELLLQRDLDEHRRREFLAVMLDEGKRLTSLLNDFLDLQRMESGRQPVVVGPVQLATLLERAVSAMPDRNHAITIELPDSLPRVLADADRIHQVIANLLTNAKKYSPRGGEIRLSARIVGAIVEIAMADSGLGIPAEALPHLFEKFYRVDNSDRRSIKGTGLGLAICWRIVTDHGGSIWAESDGLGHGSTFRFTLPIIHEGIRQPGTDRYDAHKTADVVPSSLPEPGSPAERTARSARSGAASIVTVLEPR